jgi:IclR family transcriptional regulator, acetate operon repressor
LSLITVTVSDLEIDGDWYDPAMANDAGVETGMDTVKGLASVDNALRLLEMLGEHQILRVSDAAGELGVARSTAHRLLAALRQRGFAIQDRPNGAYRAGPALNEIGIAAIGRIDVRRLAAPVLEDLRNTTRETTSLCLLEGAAVRFHVCVESPQSVRVGDRTGMVLPAHCTAGGKAILATLSGRDLERRYPGRVLDGRTPSSVTTWSQLTDELEQIREQGYARNFEEGEDGISAVATAVPDLVGSAPAAIAVVVPASRMPDGAAALAFVPRLMEAKAALRAR